MIRHIVMFKLKDFPGETEKMKAAQEVIKRLNELPLKIEVIRKYEAGVDLRKLSWSYDVVLTMDFDNLTDLETYTVHPVHQEFIVFNKDYSVEKVCIDYEV
jgi:DNA-binding Lrp family transcriptional regulator